VRCGGWRVCGRGLLLLLLLLSIVKRQLIASWIVVQGGVVCSHFIHPPFLQVCDEAGVGVGQKFGAR